MWNNYFSGHTRRDIPQVNYNEESDEEEYDSPLVSPVRPLPTRAGSPIELAVPTLNDNVDEELAAVAQSLINVSHTHAFRNTRPDTRPDPEGDESVSADKGKDDRHQEVTPEVEVTSGIVVGTAGSGNVKDHGVIMPDVRYDTADGQDEADVYSKLKTLKGEFTKDDPKFWFTNFERSIKHYGVKSQVTKKETLINLLTKEAVDECKNLISLDKDEHGDTPYLDLKTELLSIYGPRPEDSYAKAASRVLVGKPSTLAKQIMNDICECAKTIECKRCAKIAYGMWLKNLPTYVRTHISDQTFSAATYKAVLDMADKAWLSHRPETPAVSAIKAENKSALENSTDLENPAVAALRKQNRGNNRGGRVVVVVEIPTEANVVPDAAPVEVVVVVVSSVPAILKP